MENRFKQLLIIILVLLAGMGCKSKKNAPQETSTQTGETVSAQKSDSALDSQLFQAATEGNTALVKSLLDRGANVNSSDPNHDQDNPDYNAKTAVEAAVTANSYETVKLLFSMGAKMPSGSEALHTLLQREKNPDIRILKEISSNGFPLDRNDLGGDPPIRYAVDFGHAAITEYLLSKGCKYIKPGIGPLNKEQTMKAVREIAEAASRNTDNMLFEGIFISARTGFEGDGFYITLKGDDGKTALFRFDSMPEKDFFVLDSESGMPAMNTAQKGKRFVIGYKEGTETDPRGEEVKVNKVTEYERAY